MCDENALSSILIVNRLDEENQLTRKRGDFVHNLALISRKNGYYLQKNNFH